MSGLSMPIPKALVAEMMRVAPDIQRAYTSRREDARIPAWYGSAESPARVSRTAHCSAPLRVPA